MNSYDTKKLRRSGFDYCIIVYFQFLPLPININENLPKMWNEATGKIERIGFTSIGYNTITSVDKTFTTWIVNSFKKSLPSTPYTL